MKKGNNQGFSLIELIIVIAIMAVLVAIIAPNLSSNIHKSKKNTDISNADTMEDVISAALQSFIADEEMHFEKAGVPDVSSTIRAANNYLVPTAGSSNIMSLNTFISKCAGADDGTFLNGIYKSLEKNIDSNNEINTKIQSNAYYIRFEGSYEEGYTCDIIIYDKSKTPTDADFV